MKLHATFGILGLLALTGMGCKSKDDIALEKVAARKPPGFFRIVNLTDKEIRGFDNNRPVGIAPANGFSKPTTLGAGDRTVVIRGGKDPETKVSFKVTTKMVYTAIVWPDGSVTGLAEGQPRLPEELTNGYVVFADQNGVKTAGNASIVTPAGSKLDVAAGKTLTLGPGEYKSTDGQATVKVESQFCYSLMFLDYQGKTYPVFAINSDDVKASIGGMTAN